MVVNKPFKSAVRSAFRDHLDTLFQTHLATGHPPTDFGPEAHYGCTEARNSRSQDTRDEGLHKKSFLNDGLFTQMRSPEM